jgi:carbonic anhydrase/acetyltransferase-like protein (isoleucine patch superfamily)
MDGARVQRHAMVAAGAVVSIGKVVLSNQMWAGVPAVYVRDLLPEEIEAIVEVAKENVEVRMSASQIQKYFDYRGGEVFDTFILTNLPSNRVTI